MAIKYFICLKGYLRNHEDWRTEPLSPTGKDIFSLCPFIFWPALEVTHFFLLWLWLYLVFHHKCDYSVLFLCRIQLYSHVVAKTRPYRQGFIIPQDTKAEQTLKNVKSPDTLYDVAMWQKSMPAPREFQYLFTVNNCRVWAVVLWKRLETVSQD